MIRYTIEDIKKLEEYINIYEFSDEILNTINTIAKRVGSSNYIKTPVFIKQNKIKPKPKPIESDKEIMLKEIQSILNKMSSKTYEKLKNDIFKLINSINDLKNNISSTGELSNGESSDNKISMNEISEKIFNTASGSKINPNIYADLYKELSEIYPSFIEDCSRFYEVNINQFNNIHLRDSNKDYETFCKDNIENQKIRSLLLFYIELSKRSVIELDSVLNILDILTTKLEYYIDKYLENDNPCSEYVENIYLIVTNSYENIYNLDKWSGIYDRLKNVKNFDKNKNINLTGKVKFKLMDILDFVEKKCK
tara:strand:+ start:2622 stop:3548 length:927 start_codon:yes stop_codon:yes gene_type:complete